MTLSRRALLAGATATPLSAAGVQPFRVASPDASVEAQINLGETLSWEVRYAGRPALLPAPLGLSLYSGRYLYLGHGHRESRSEWKPVYGERDTIPDRYNELTLRLRDRVAPHRELHVILRAYDEGAAVRYRIAGSGPFLYSAEFTGFRFPAAAHAWEEHGTEGEYARVPVAAIKPGCERPLTVELGDGRFLSVTEAGNLDYPRMLLSPLRGAAGTLVSDLAGAVRGSAPYETPWRLVVAGARPGDLTERSYMAQNLSPESRVADTSWIRPGKVMREVTISTQGGKELVDFAVARGLQYIEYDAGWYGHEYHEASDATRVAPDPDRIRNIPGHAGLDLPEVLRYARQKGIGVWLYVNRRALERQLDQILPLFQQWGVAGVKFGFVNTGPGEWTAWLHDAVRRAGEHRLMVDVHDGYRPTGTSRTYPHWLTQEGVRGNEHMPTAAHNTILPFTRAVAGAADTTICYYTPRIRTTRAHQLAHAVVMYSPLQFLFWYDKPSDYRGEPEVKFFRDVPTVWSETRVLDGRIGEFVVTARRSGAAWFLGAITNGQGRELKIPLNFLAAGRRYTAEIYCDAGMQSRQVDRAGALDLSLPPSGGCAIRFTP